MPDPGGPTCGGSGSASQGNSSGTNTGAGNPIDITSGNKYQREVDLPALPGVLGLEIVRHYNSMTSGFDAKTGIFGRGWKLSYESELFVDGEDALRVVQADGAVIVFHKERAAAAKGRAKDARPADGTAWVSADPQQGRLDVLRTGDGKQYRWRWGGAGGLEAAGRELLFDGEGRLIQISAPTGEFVTMQRDRDGMLLRVTDPQGRSLVLNYLDKKSAQADRDNNQRFRGVQSIDSPVGRFGYAYNDFGKLTPDNVRREMERRHVDPVTLLPNLVKVALPTHYEADTKAHPYANRGLSSSTVSRLYHYENAAFPTLLTGITVSGQGSDGVQMLQRISTYLYDDKGRANLSVRGEPARLQRDASGKPTLPWRLVEGTGIEQVTLERPSPNVVVLTNALGQTTRYLTAKINGQMRIIEARGAGCSSCGPSNVRNIYDEAARLIGIVQLADDGQPTTAQRWEFDDMGRLARTGSVTYTVSKAGPTRWNGRYAYAGTDPRPSLIARPSVLPGKEQVTHVEYNNVGQPIAVTQSGFSPVDGSGHLIDQGFAIARTTSMRYQTIDGKSVLVERDGPLPNGPTNSPEDSDVVRLHWDSVATHVVAITRPGGIKTTLTRDHAGRIVESAFQDAGHRVRTALSYASHPLFSPTEWVQSTWSVDAALQIVGVPAVRRATAQHAANGLLSRLDIDGRTVQDAEIATWRRRLLGEPSATREPAISPEQTGSQPSLARARLGVAGEAVDIGWGTEGSVAQSAVVSMSNGQRVAQRLFDDFDRIVAIRNPQQGVQTALYDEADHLLERFDPTGNRQVWKWNTAGLPLSRQTFRAGAGRPEQTIQWKYIGPWLSEEILADVDGIRRTRTERDAEGRPLAEVESIEPAGPLRAHVAQAIVLTQRHQYDEQGRRTASVFIDASGRRHTFSYRFDDRGELDRISASNGLPAWLGGEQAVIDHVEWQHLPGLAYATAVVHANGWVDRYQPVRPEHPGRPPTLPTGALSETQNRAARSVGTIGLDQSARSSTVRDDAGLPVEMTTRAGRQRLEWNGAGQLIQVSNTRWQSRYLYDARGRRVVKLLIDKTNGDTVVALHAYEDTRLIAETNAAGGMAYRYAYLGWRPVAQIALPNRGFFDRVGGQAIGGEVRHIHSGRAGEALRASNRAGQIVWQADSALPGEPTLVRAALATQTQVNMHQPLRYVGQFRDAETGLDYHGARYFDSLSGRFISPDPSGISDAVAELAAPELLDLYVYAGGRPDVFFDPDGAARVRYYAITTGANGNAIGTARGFTQARWAFVVDNIATGGNTSTTLGQKRNEYASNGEGLLYDLNGNFLSAGQSNVAWTSQSSATFDSFTQHYGSSLLSIPEFTIDNYDDDRATELIASFIQADRDQLFPSGSCPLRSTLLPPIVFAAGEMDINVWRATEPAGNAPAGANAQRILNCDPVTTMPVTFTNDQERSRVLKFEAAAELQESPAPSAIKKDCSNNNGCRSGTAITANGHSYYASYGRTQFVTETFLGTLQNSVINDPAVTAAQRTALRLDQAVTLPSGAAGTMADLVPLARARASAAGNAYRRYRNRFGRGLTATQAQQAWNSLSQAERTDFTRTTGLGEVEFLDMLGYQIAPPARTENEGLNAFASEAAKRLQDGNGQTVFGDWLMWLYSSQDEYNFVSESFLKNNLDAISTQTPAATLQNTETPGTPAYLNRQRAIEFSLAQRVALLHNGGNSYLGTATSANFAVPANYLGAYVNQFTTTASRGDWESLRCSGNLMAIPGLQMTPLRVN